MMNSKIFNVVRGWNFQFWGKKFQHIWFVMKEEEERGLRFDGFGVERRFSVKYVKIKVYALENSSVKDE